MYNPALKKKYLEKCVTSESRAVVIKRVFSAFEKHENLWQADLCTKNADVLQPIIDEITGIRLSSQYDILTILKEYVLWCMAENVPGVCDGMLQIKDVGLKKMRRQLVSSPLHLQKYMDEIFDDEETETMDVLYRCYYWMAFAGIKEEDILQIKCSDVDFSSMSIYYGETSAPIYREGILAFRKAIELKYFRYIHPNYEPILRERIPGETIMRGIKAVTKSKTIRSFLSRYSSRMCKEGKTDMQLSYSRVRLSGIFFRVYENERLGIPPNFTDVIMDEYPEKLREKYQGDEKEFIRYQKRRMNAYMEDYRRWKLAFAGI